MLLRLDEARELTDEPLVTPPEDQSRIWERPLPRFPILGAVAKAGEQMADTTASAPLEGPSCCSVSGLLAYQANVGYCRLLSKVRYVTLDSYRPCGDLETLDCYASYPKF